MTVTLAVLATASLGQALSPSARVTAQGLGPIRIGMTVTQARAANGGRLTDLSNAAGDGSCASGSFAPKVYGLFTRGVLARIYVRTAHHRTSRGIRVGDTASDVRRAYGRLVTSVMAPYDPSGRLLRVTTGNRRVTFTTRASGRITEISTGRLPEINYIEGCA